MRAPSLIVALPPIRLRLGIALHCPAGKGTSLIPRYDYVDHYSQPPEMPPDDNVMECYGMLWDAVRCCEML